jgi:GTP-binding protein HflX
VGTRGPGEKQIETDRRLVQKRIQDLKARLREQERRTRQSIAARANAQQVALAGYTNTGKSTLFNALTGADVYTADRLFATLDTRTRRWEIPGCGELLLSDTVGFVRDLPHHLVASFHATLEEVIEADLLLHVVDASDPDAARRMRAVREVIAEIEADAVPSIVVLNKVDRVVDTMELQALRNAEPGAVVVSARTGQGLDELAARVKAHFAAQRRRFRVSIPLAAGRVMAELRRLATIERTEASDDCLTFGFSIDHRQVPRLKAWASAAQLSLERS